MQPIIVELRYPFWIKSIRGEALARFLIYDPVSKDFEWLCETDETGDLTILRNDDIRTAKRPNAPFFVRRAHKMAG